MLASHLTFIMHRYLFGFAYRQCFFHNLAGSEFHTGFFLQRLHQDDAVEQILAFDVRSRWFFG